MKRAVTNLILDSGAFSAWNSGQVIDLDDYASFIESNRAWITNYINLDVIPETPELPKDASRLSDRARRDLAEHLRVEALEKAAEASWRNLELLGERGLDPIPVFHRGEDWKWLHRMLDDGYDYICLGGAWRSANIEVGQWFDAVFSRLERERPVRVHGLGVTRLDMIVRHPWYSVDSISWILSAAYGSIIIPVSTSNGYDYSKRRTITVSDNADSRSSGKGPPPPNSTSMRLLTRYLESIGSTFEACRFGEKAWYERAYVNAVYYQGMIEQHNAAYQKHSRPRVNLHFAQGPLFPSERGLPLCRADAGTRLVSYNDLRKLAPNVLRDYVTEGVARVPTDV